MSFLVNSQESSRGPVIRMGNGQTRMVLDFDLNKPPPPEDLTPSYPLTGQGNGFYQNQITNEVDLDLDLDLDLDESADDESSDDDVVVISPRNFAEASRNARRSQEDISFGYLEDCLYVSRFGIGTIHDLITVSEPEDSSSTQDLAVPAVSSLAGSQQGTPTLNCGICMDPLVEETATKCGHVFCRVCIEAVIMTQRKCPTCRQKLNSHDTIRIYLPRSN